MEGVLDLYAEPYDEARPVVNFDEKSKQLVAETRTPIPAEPGRAERFDYEYRRGGVANLFAFCEARAGWRHFNVTERHTKQDFAAQMKWLADEQYPQAERIPLWHDVLGGRDPAPVHMEWEESGSFVVEPLKPTGTPIKSLRPGDVRQW